VQLSADTLIITGARGLIGSAIAREWQRRELPWVGIDDGRAATVSVKQLDGLVVDGSVESVAQLNLRFAVGCSAIVHCASPVGPVGILGGDVLLSMLSATEAALSLAARAQCAVVVFSSSEVHGTETPLDTLIVRDGPWAPRSEYQVGKIAVELLAKRHHELTGLPTMIVRPWNIVGPEQSARKGFVIPRFVDQALAGGPLTVYGDGMQRRAFADVDELADLLCERVQCSIANDWNATPLDAANPDNATTMLQLARLVSWDFKGVSIEHVDPRELHGPHFRESASGSKLPPANPAIRCELPLDVCVERAIAARRGTVPA
jgi:nucleoside-diphosphate-sugar epimerase